MKKSAILFYTAAQLMLCISAAAQPNSIVFYDTTWAAVKAKAKTEGKPIYVDCYTTWCGPCKWMNKNVFTNKEVADYYNTHFINVKMDMEKGEGKDMASRSRVKSYPTFLYFDKNGKTMHRTQGTRDTATFLQDGKDALNPKNQLLTWHKKYSNGNRDSKFIRDFLMMRKKLGLRRNYVTKPMAHWYFALELEKGTLLSKENIGVIDAYLDGIEHPAFNYFYTHRKEFAQLGDSAKVYDKIFKLYKNAFQKAYVWQQQDDGGWQQELNDSIYQIAKNTVQNSGFERSDEIIKATTPGYYFAKKEWGNYAKTVIEYEKAYPKDNWNWYNSVAWDFYEKIDDKKLLEQALKWAEKSLEFNEYYANTDTKASVLYKLGRKEEALKTAKKAVEMGKANGSDVKVTEELVEKIKGLK